MTHSLAILGGEPVRRSGWPEWPQPTQAALDNLSAVLASHRWTVRGWYTGTESFDSRFAKACCQFFDVPYCVPTASGSAALTIALEALDIGFGDEVIVPGLTWIAPATAVVNVNAIPVFADVCPDTLCISPRAVEAAITKRTRCILVVHLHCTVADLDSILDIARRYELVVLEDASQAHGATWRGRRVGTFGDIGVFSMNQEKVLAAGEGGFAITADAVLHRRMEQLRSDGSLFRPALRRLYDYQSIEPGEVMGANLCPSEFSSAVALAGLAQLDTLNRHRTQNGLRLSAQLADVPGLRPLRQDERIGDPTFFKFAVRYVQAAFADRPLSVLCQALTAELNLPFLPIDPPLNSNDLYRPQSKRRHQLGSAYEDAMKSPAVHLPEAEYAAVSTMVFHHRALMAEPEDIEQIVTAFSKVQAHAGSLPIRHQDLKVWHGTQ